MKRQSEFLIVLALVLLFINNVLSSASLTMKTDDGEETPIKSQKLADRLNSYNKIASNIFDDLILN
jgi:hypothetical protein